MNHRAEIEAIAAYCRQHLNLKQTEKAAGHLHHPCVPFMVLDAVFSINSTANAVRNVLTNYTNYRNRAHLDDAHEHSVCKFVRLLGEVGPDAFATDVVRNRQRTSARGGILKAEAALGYGHVLAQFGVNLRADLGKILDSDRFCRRIRLIPGQAVALDYFLMMAGRTDLVKPDRMVQRFVRRCLNDQPISPVLAAHLLAEAAQTLQKDYQHLTPRLLDWIVWQHESR